MRGRLVAVAGSLVVVVVTIEQAQRGGVPLFGEPLQQNIVVSKAYCATPSCRRPGSKISGGKSFTRRDHRSDPCRLTGRRASLEERPRRPTPASTNGVNAPRWRQIDPKNREQTLSTRVPVSWFAPIAGPAATSPKMERQLRLLSAPPLADQFGLTSERNGCRFEATAGQY
jgi:hypothetical protein